MRLIYLCGNSKHNTWAWYLCHTQRLTLGLEKSIINCASPSPVTIQVSPQWLSQMAINGVMERLSKLHQTPCLTVATHGWLIQNTSSTLLSMPHWAVVSQSVSLVVPSLLLQTLNGLDTEPSTVFAYFWKVKWGVWRCSDPLLVCKYHHCHR